MEQKQATSMKQKQALAMAKFAVHGAIGVCISDGL